MRFVFGMIAVLGGAGVCAGGEPTRAFRGAYIHIDHVIGKVQDPAGRRAALATSLETFRKSGLKVAMPYIKDTGGAALYESKVVPLRRHQGWDALADFMEEARKRDIDVWPVICVVPSGGEKAPAGILDRHPDWALRDREGKPIGYLSPCNPEARAWMVSMVAEVVAKYRPQGLLLDYIRFPSQPVQFDDETNARFAREFPAPAEESDDARRLRQQAFQRADLTRLMAAISEKVRGIQPGIRIGMYTWGPQVLEKHNVSQDWRTWVAKGYVDMVNVSGYCYRDNFGDRYMTVFEDRMKDAVKVMRDAGNKAELTLTLGVKTSHGQVHSAGEIGEYRRVAREAGIEGVGFFTWSYLQPYLEESVKAGYLD